MIRTTARIKRSSVIADRALVSIGAQTPFAIMIVIRVPIGRSMHNTSASLCLSNLFDDIRNSIDYDAELILQMLHESNEPGARVKEAKVYGVREDYTRILRRSKPARFANCQSDRTVQHKPSLI